MQTAHPLLVLVNLFFFLHILCCGCHPQQLLRCKGHIQLEEWQPHAAYVHAQLVAQPHSSSQQHSAGSAAVGGSPSQVKTGGRVGGTAHLSNREETNSGIQTVGRSRER